MNNKYLILTYDICNMGGGQLFVLRRARHLKDKGFDVHIVVTYHSDYFPLKEDFSVFPFYVIPEFGIPSAKFTSRKVHRMVDDLVGKIGCENGLFIESHTLQTIEWGEIIASYCKGQHLAYPLSEPLISEYRFYPGRSIFQKKLKDKEFFGISSVSLKKIFEYDNAPKTQYVNIGYDENELSQYCEPTIKYKKSEDEFVVTTVSRLDKEYIEPLIKDTVKLAQKHSDQRFVLLIAGGSKTKGREDYLKTTYNNDSLGINNLNIVYTGYIEILGSDIFKMSDVFVGMGTASINAISQKCLTINVEPTKEHNCASGFFGTDTNNFAYTENGRLYSIYEKLEEAYLFNPHKKEELIRRARKLYDEDFKMSVCFDKLDNIIQNISSFKYYSEINISSFYRAYVICGTRLKKCFLSSMKSHKS